MGSATDRSPWLSEGEEKRDVVRKMFAEVAPTYDLVNSLICFRLHYRWRRMAAQGLGLQPDSSVLDVCCGTGDFLGALHRTIPRGKVVGVDFCAPMLDVARKKGPNERLSLGDATRLPFRERSFEGVTVGWGLRNVPSIPEALAEAYRVLKPGGRFVTLDMARPRSKFIGRTSEFVFHRVVPLVGRLFGKSEAYTYLPKSTVRFLDREQLKSAMQVAGFEDVRWRDVFFGNVCMHWGTKP